MYSGRWVTTFRGTYCHHLQDTSAEVHMEEIHSCEMLAPSYPTARCNKARTPHSVQHILVTTVPPE
jgi:hypothetical protein